MCIIGQLENEVEYKTFMWQRHFNNKKEAMSKSWMDYKEWQKILTFLWDEKADAEYRLREKRKKPCEKLHAGWTLGSIHPNYGCGCKK